MFKYFSDRFWYDDDSKTPFALHYEETDDEVAHLIEKPSKKPSRDYKNIKLCVKGQKTPSQG
jgi:hypothetical protein